MGDREGGQVQATGSRWLCSALPPAFLANHLTDRSSLELGPLLCQRPHTWLTYFSAYNSSSFISTKKLLSYVSLFLIAYTAHTMSPYPLIKSESPPLHSVPISSVGQPYSHYSDTASLFRFGPKEQNAPLPPFSFLSRPRSSSSFSPHSAMSHLNAYSPNVSNSQSHFAVPADELTPTDEYDDGDEGGDFPSASGSSSKDKSVRRRSSKGPLPFYASGHFDCTDCGPRTSL